MALTEIGARLRLQGASAFKKDTEAGATALGKMAKQAGVADQHVAKLEKTAKRAKTSLHGMTIGRIAGLASIAAATASITAFGKSSVDAYKEATREAIGLRRVMGGTIEDASRLKFAAHESGVSYDTLGKSVRLLSKNLLASEKIQQVRTRSHKMEIVTVPRLVKGQIKYVKALRDTGTTTTKFVKISKDLGFTWRDAHGQILPMAKLLPRIAERFKTMPDGVEKTALALKLFGRGGTEMLPFLNRGAEGIAELTKQSDKFGATITGKDAANMKAYIQSQREWKAAIEGVKISLGRELMPTFTQWARFLGAHAPEINAWGRKYIPELGRGLAEAGRDAKAISAYAVPPLRWMSEHPNALKGIVEGLVAYKVAMAGAVIYTRSMAFWAPKAALGEAAVGASGATAAATGVTALGTALAEFAGPAAAVWGSLQRISAVVKGLRGDIDPLLRLSEFGLGSKPKGTNGDLQKQIAGMTPAKREQFYGWYPNLRPPAASTVIPSNKPHVNPNGRVATPNIKPRVVRRPGTASAQVVTPPPTILHANLYVDGRKVSETVVSNMEDRLARQ